MRIQISIAEQRLDLFAPDGACIRRYSVSTAANGPGERQGSHCTPRGRHRIRARIGGDAPVGAVFRGRRPTGEMWTPEFAARHPGRDWILSRILWLCGCQPGFNRLGGVDSRVDPEDVDLRVLAGESNGQYITRLARDIDRRRRGGHLPDGNRRSDGARRDDPLAPLAPLANHQKHRHCEE